MKIIKLYFVAVVTVARAYLRADWPGSRGTLERSLWLRRQQSWAEKRFGSLGEN